MLLIGILKSTFDSMGPIQCSLMKIVKPCLIEGFQGRKVASWNVKSWKMLDVWLPIPRIYSMFTIDKPINCQTLSVWLGDFKGGKTTTTCSSVQEPASKYDILNQKWTLALLSHISVLRRWHGQWSSGTSKKYKRKIWHYEEI